MVFDRLLVLSPGSTAHVFLHLVYRNRVEDSNAPRGVASRGNVCWRRYVMLPEKQTRDYPTVDGAFTARRASCSLLIRYVSL